MKYQYLTMTLWVSLTGATSHFDLPEIIYDMCPYSDICNRTASKTLKKSGFVPCCTSCKCDENCGLRLDCCFDDMDQYRLKDKGIVGCVNPSNNINQRTTFEYWMIQTCKNKTAESFQNFSYVPCELYDRNGESVIEPVSSVETGYIYVNAKCANCNQVYDFNKWNYIFITQYKRSESLTWDIENNLKERVGEIIYIPPRGENWSTKRCVSETKLTCDTNSPFEKLCQTLQAPVRTVLNLHLKNPMCLLCIERLGLPPSECRDELARTPTRKLTVIIDNSIIATSKIHKSVMINNSLKSDCPSKLSVRSESNTCLQIHCPDGMVRTLLTGCTYFIRRWYISSFTITFELWAEIGNELPAEDLKTLTVKERRNPLLWMKLPCQKMNASVIEVFYKKGKNDNGVVNSLIVTFSKLTPAGINPSVTIPALQRCLKYNWYIKILGTTYTFHPSLKKQTEININKRKFRMNKLTGRIEDTPAPNIYEYIASGPGNKDHLRPGLKKILKTFFCDQVNVPIDDVEVYFGEIRIISKNITLGNDEFTINFFTLQNGDTSDHERRNITFSVCLEDYDKTHHQIHSMSAMFPRSFALEPLILYSSIIQLCI